MAAVRQAVENWRSILKAGEKEQEYAAEEERLRHQLAVYREKGVETHLARLTTFDSDKRNFAEFIQHLENLHAKLEKPDDEWAELNTGWLVLKSEFLAEQAGKVSAERTAFKSFLSDYQSALTRLNDLNTRLRAVFAEVQTEERRQQEAFAALQREIDAPGLNLDEFRARKSRHEQLVKLLAAAGNRPQMAAEALVRVESSARGLADFRRDRHREELEKLNAKAAVLPDSLRLSIDFEGDSGSFRDFLKSKFAGSGFHNNSLGKLVESHTNGFALFAHREAVMQSLAGRADAAKFQETLMTHLADTLTFEVPARRTIRFNGVAIAELSLGQRATALLQLLMSLEDHPILLLDQPEDDLDNETIFRHVVEPLLKRKPQRQFLIATHNPNIPVLGDAELVHACHERGKGSYDHNSGSLDSAVTRKEIVTIMEGGAQAFEQRQKIYSQWTNSL